MPLPRSRNVPGSGTAVGWDNGVTDPGGLGSLSSASRTKGVSVEVAGDSPANGGIASEAGGPGPVGGVDGPVVGESKRLPGGVIPGGVSPDGSVTGPTGEIEVPKGNTGTNGEGRTTGVSSRSPGGTLHRHGWAGRAQIPRHEATGPTSSSASNCDSSGSSAEVGSIGSSEMQLPQRARISVWPLVRMVHDRGCELFLFVQ